MTWAAWRTAGTVRNVCAEFYYRRTPPNKFCWPFKAAATFLACAQTADLLEVAPLSNSKFFRNTHRFREGGVGQLLT